MRKRWSYLPTKRIRLKAIVGTRAPVLRAEDASSAAFDNLKALTGEIAAAASIKDEYIIGDDGSMSPVASTG